MVKRGKLHNRICLAVMLVLAILLLAFLQRLLVPKYMGSVKEGAYTGEYYLDTCHAEGSESEAKSHQVIFLGDCEVYDNISTEALWESYGISSYIRGNAKQTMWQSYYLLEDTLRYEKPQVVVLSVFGMQFADSQGETFNRMALDGMKLSLTKLKAIKASMGEEESFASYLFPILRFHERIWELEKEDFTYYWKADKVTSHGYVKHTEVDPLETIPDPIPKGSYEFGEKPYEYLDKMRNLCDENGIELVLYKAPSIYPSWYPEWERQVDDYAKEHNLIYINSYEVIDEIGIDYQRDTYDKGLHLNDSGARKMAAYIGRIILDNRE